MFMKTTQTNTIYALIGKDINTSTIKYYEKFSHLGNWIYITPEPEIKEEFWIKIIDESSYLEKSTIQKYLIHLSEKSSFEKKYAINWYYQQFLKYAVVLQNMDFKYVQIIDADTYLSEQCLTNFLIPSITRKKFELYNNFNKKYITTQNKKNNVCNYMPFQPNILDRMITNKFGDYNNLISEVVVTNTTNIQTRFSEYQLYSDYVHSIGPTLFYNIKMFRRYDLISRSIPQTFNYDALCIETQHKKNLIKLVIAKIFYKLGFTWE